MKNSPHYLVDAEKRIEDLGLVAVLIIRTAGRYSQSMAFSEREKRDYYPDVLAVLSQLVAAQLNIEDVRSDWFTNEHADIARAEIDEALRKRAL